MHAANRSTARFEPQYVALGIHHDDALAGTNRDHITVPGTIPFHRVTSQPW